VQAAGTRVWGAVALVVFVLVSGGELASLMAAAQFDLSHSKPPMQLFGHALYAPWQWLLWIEAFGRNLPEALLPARNVGYGSIGLITLIAIAFRLWTPAAAKTTHGSARWASEDELREAGLSTDGVVLCQTDDARYVCETREGDEARWVLKEEGALLCDNTDGHVLVTAYTRSGKGVGCCVPTGLTWRHSVIFYDLKKELWKICAGFRALFSRVWRWEPTEKDSVKFNPLFEIRRGDHDVGDAQMIANILCGTHEDSDHGGGSNQHWKLTGTDLITCGILHMLYAGKRKSLAGVRELLTGGADSLPQEEILQRMICTPHLGDRPHPQVVQFATNGLNMAPNERSSVFSTANSHLGVFLDPIIARNTDTSDFAIKQLVELDEPVSLFLVVPPPDEMRMRPLVRMMFQLIGSVLMRELDAGGPAPKRTLWQRLRDAFVPPTAARRWRHRLLMFVDEFPDLGKVPFFEKMMAKSAGYLIKLVLIAQSMSQIRAVYGTNQAIQENCRTQLNYGANAYETAEYISKMFGQRTVVEERVSKARKAGSLFASSYTSNVHEFARPLIAPEDVMTLRFDRALIKVTGAHPGSAKKVMYYQDSRFRDRAWLPRPDSPEAQRAELPQRVSHGWDNAPIPHSEELLRALKERRAKQKGDQPAAAQPMAAQPIECTDAVADDLDALDESFASTSTADGWVDGEVPV
jgi:type IV secretion system protein VirD4